MDIISKLKHAYKKHHITALNNGKIIRVENIPDKAFSQKLVGDGIAMKLSSPTIYAPCDGTITTIATTRHAFIITLDDGAQLLVHVGINKKKPNIDDYNYNVSVGDRVKREMLILTLSDSFVEANNKSVIIPIIMLNSNIHPIRTFTTCSSIKEGKLLFTYK